MLLALLRIFKSLLCLNVSLVDSDLLFGSDLLWCCLCLQIAHDVDFRLVGLYQFLLERFNVEDFAVSGARALWSCCFVLRVLARAYVPLYVN